MRTMSSYCVRAQNSRCLPAGTVCADMPSKVSSIVVPAKERAVSASQPSDAASGRSDAIARVRAHPRFISLSLAQRGT